MREQLTLFDFCKECNDWVEGRPALDPRPSTRRTKVCPNCLSEVK